MKNKIKKIGVIFCLLVLIAPSLLLGKSMRIKKYFQNEDEQNFVKLVEKRKFDKASILLDQGVSVDIQGKDGITPLIWMLIKQKKKSFEFLLKANANPNLQMKNGDSAVLFASMHKNAWYLSKVLEHDGNPNLVDTRSFQTPIYDSIKCLRFDLVKLLVQHGADLTFQDKDGNTPLHLAAMLNQYEMVYYMVENGGNPFVKDRFGYTIEYSMENNRIDKESDGYTWMNKVKEKMAQLKKSSKGSEYQVKPDKKIRNSKREKQK